MKVLKRRFGLGVTSIREHDDAPTVSLSDQQMEVVNAAAADVPVECAMRPFVRTT